MDIFASMGYTSVIYLLWITMWTYIRQSDKTKKLLQSLILTVIIEIAMNFTNHNGAFNFVDSAALYNVHSQSVTASI